MANNTPKVPQIRFKGFTDAWIERKLGDIASFYSGGTPLIAHKEYYGNEIPFIRSGEISKNSTELFITQVGLRNSSAKLVKKGNILYALYGATSGEVAISQIDGAINQAILAIIPDENNDSFFITQWLRSNKDRIISTFLQGGQGNLSSELVKSLIILAPNLKLQTKVGTFFKHLDELIALYKQKHEKLQEIKKALLEKMFPKNGDTKPQIRFKGFTDAWVKRKLRECGKFKSNGVDKKIRTGEVPVNLLNYMDVYNGLNITSKNCSELMQVTAKLKQVQENNVLKNDIFFTPTSETPEDIGRVNVIEEDLDNTVYSYHLVRYRPYADVFYSVFPKYAFAHNSIRKQMILAAQGVQRFVINRSEFEELNVDIPSYTEQSKIGTFFKHLDELISLYKQKHEKLQNVKKALLEKMFV